MSYPIFIVYSAVPPPYSNSPTTTVNQKMLSWPYCACKPTQNTTIHRPGVCVCVLADLGRLHGLGYLCRKAAAGGQGSGSAAIQTAQQTHGELRGSG